MLTLCKPRLRISRSSLSSDATVYTLAPLRDDISSSVPLSEDTSLGVATSPAPSLTLSLLPDLGSVVA